MFYSSGLEQDVHLISIPKLALGVGEMKKCDPYAIETATRLALVRGWLGLTVSEMSRTLGVPASYWGTFELPQRKNDKCPVHITHPKARLLKKFHGVPVDWMLDGDISDRMPAGLVAYINKQKIRLTESRALRVFCCLLNY